MPPAGKRTLRPVPVIVLAVVLAALIGGGVYLWVSRNSTSPAKSTVHSSLPAKKPSTKSATKAPATTAPTSAPNLAAPAAGTASSSIGGSPNGSQTAGTSTGTASSGKLTNTGPGQTVELFIAVSAVMAAFHYLITYRRLRRTAGH